eukprot:2305032-Rhodomonas_salina.4
MPLCIPAIHGPPTYKEKGEEVCVRPSDVADQQHCCFKGVATCRSTISQWKKGGREGAFGCANLKHDGSGKVAVRTHHSDTHPRPPVSPRLRRQDRGLRRGRPRVAAPEPKCFLEGGLAWVLLWQSHASRRGVSLCATSVPCVVGSQNTSREYRVFVWSWARKRVGKRPTESPTRPRSTGPSQRGLRGQEVPRCATQTSTPRLVELGTCVSLWRCLHARNEKRMKASSWLFDARKQEQLCQHARPSALASGWM